MTGKFLAFAHFLCGGEPHIQQDKECERNVSGNIISSVPERDAIVSQDSTNEDRDSDQRLLSALRSNLEYVKGISISDRPHIPKIDTRCCTTRSVIDKVDKMLEKVQSSPSSLLEINCLIWAGAKTVTEYMGLKLHSSNHSTNHKKKAPEWKKRLQTKIAELHKDVAQLGEVDKGNIKSNRMKSNTKRLQKKYRIDDKTRTRTTVIETLKMKINALKHRVKRYTKSNNFKRQNKLFHGNRKKFFRELDSKMTETKDVPSADDMKNYWKELWDNDITHEETPWIQSEADKWSNVPKRSS
nr:uncharacterized protein LOC129276003 [Lytechinus pictus]